MTGRRDETCTTPPANSCCPCTWKQRITEAEFEAIAEGLYFKMAHLDAVDLGAWADLSDFDREFYRHCVAEVLRLVPAGLASRSSLFTHQAPA